MRTVDSCILTLWGLQRPGAKDVVRDTDVDVFVIRVKEITEAFRNVGLTAIHISLALFPEIVGSVILHWDCKDGFYPTESTVVSIENYNVLTLELTDVVPAGWERIQNHLYKPEYQQAIVRYDISTNFLPDQQLNRQLAKDAVDLDTKIRSQFPLTGTISLVIADRYIEGFPACVKAVVAMYKAAWAAFQAAKDT